MVVTPAGNPAALRLVAAATAVIGLAAVATAVAMLRDPLAFGIGDRVIPMIGQPFAVLRPTARIGVVLTAAAGALACSGGTVALGRPNGVGLGRLAGRFSLGALALLLLVPVVAAFRADQTPAMFWAATGLAISAGFLLASAGERVSRAALLVALAVCAGAAVVAIGLTVARPAAVAAGVLLGIAFPLYLFAGRSSQKG